MKLRMHHIELCVSHPNTVSKLFCNQLGLNFVGYRESVQCLQLIFQMEKATFVVTSRKDINSAGNDNNNNIYPDILFESGALDDGSSELRKDSSEAWTLFCCKNPSGVEDKEFYGENGDDDDDVLGNCKNTHIDSVFNVAIEVRNVRESVNKIRNISADLVLQDVERVYDPHSKLGYVDYAVIKSCCGNVVHTLVEKSQYRGWFLPGFFKVDNDGGTGKCGGVVDDQSVMNMTHFDHFTLACRVGESNEIMDWYERAFGMKRFITNRQETELEGLVIGDDVGLRLKVMQFWKCSESGLSSDVYDDGESEPLKIVIAESLPNISNTQIEGFLRFHGGPGIQHVGLHTSNMVKTVEVMTRNGVRFRHPPPTYYTEIGQLEVIKSVGEDVGLLQKYGILLDNEADVFDDLGSSTEDRYLMQIFTYPVFNRDTFFLEVIQRKGARGFGVGNVTALARSVNAYNQAMLLLHKQMMMRTENNNDGGTEMLA